MSEVVIIAPVIKPTEQPDVVFSAQHLTTGEAYSLTAYVSERHAYRMTIAVQDADVLPRGSYSYELQDTATDEIIGMGLLVVGDSTTTSPATYETDNTIQTYEQ